MRRLQLDSLLEAFDRCIEYWHDDPADYRGAAGALNTLALDLAYKNYLLWHEEDKARRTDVDNAMIAAVKRAIDGYNQQRNDLIEKLDEYILAWLEANPTANPSQEINSETPGSIVDRISILSLKIYHMAEDSRRTDISEEHRQKSQHRLAILTVQRQDLYSALQKLIDDYLSGRKQMKLYRQFKMYNDPSLNRELYKRKKD